MKFYRLDLSKRFYSSKKTYAYLDVNKYNEVPVNYKGLKIENLMFLSSFLKQNCSHFCNSVIDSGCPLTSNHLSREGI